MKKYIIAAICVVLVCLAGFLLTKKTVTRTEYAMNTMVGITATAHSPADAVDKAFGEIMRIESLMSVTIKDSEISRINNAPAGTPVEVSQEVFDLIKMCMEVSRISDGAFDISVTPINNLWETYANLPVAPPDEDIERLLTCTGYENIILDEDNRTVALTKYDMCISLGAVAKGYAADRAAEILRAEGIKDAIIDLGGNIYVIGKDKKIGIQEPCKNRGEYFRVCTVSDRSVVTSGGYERYFKVGGEDYHHIIDPKTGRSAQNGVQSATVICKNSALADALSTALFVAGADGAQRIVDAFPEAEAILYGDGGKITEYK